MNEPPSAQAQPSVASRPRLPTQAWRHPGRGTFSSDPSETNDLAAGNADKARDLQDWISQFAGEMAPPLLILDAVRLIFQAPPVAADPATLFSLGD